MSKNFLASDESFKCPIPPINYPVLLSFGVLLSSCPRSALGLDRVKAQRGATQTQGAMAPFQALTTSCPWACKTRYTPNWANPASCDSAGCTPQFFSNHLWWTAANVHCARGGGVCERNPGEHAQHCAHWAVDGCCEATIYCQDSRQPPLFFLR